MILARTHLLHGECDKLLSLHHNENSRKVVSPCVVKGVQMSVFALSILVYGMLSWLCFVFIIISSTQQSNMHRISLHLAGTSTWTQG